MFRPTWRTAALLLGTALFSPPGAFADSPPSAEKQAHVDALGDALPEQALARLGSLRWRHSAQVVFTAYVEKDKHLLTVSADGLVRVWDANSGKELRKFGKAAPDQNNGGQMQINGNGAVMLLAAQANHVTAAALSADGKTLALSAPDAAITLWNIADGKQLKSFKSNPAVYVTALAFAPDGKTLVAKSNNMELRLWDIEEGKERRKFGQQPNPNRQVFYIGGPSASVSFSADAKVLISAGMEFKNRQISAHLRRWEIESGKEMPVIDGPQGGFQSLALAPDGKSAVFGNNDGTMRLWDLATGKQLRQLALQGPVPTTMVFSPDSKLLAARSWEHVVRVWDTTTGKEIRQLAGQDNPNNGVVRVWGGNVNGHLSFSSDGKRVASSTTGNTVRQWETATGKEAGESSGHHGPVTQIALSADGKTAATRGGDNTVHLWDAKTGKEVSKFQLPGGVAHVVLSADGSTAAAGAAEGTLHTLDVKTGKEVKHWKAHQNGFQALAISPDGKLVASRSYDQTIRLWNAQTGQEVRQIAQAANNNNPGNGVFVVRAIGFNNTVPSLAFTPDGSGLALLVGGTGPLLQAGIGGVPMPPQSSQVHLWEVSSGKELRRFDAGGKGVASFAFSPDGRTLALATQDATISLHETITGKERFTIKNIGTIIGVLTYSADGRSLIGASGQDSHIRIWNAATGKEVRRLKGHEDMVVALAIDHRGERLLSGSADSTALVWPLPEAEKQKALDLDAAAVNALWSDLASEDARAAYTASHKLAAAPAKSVPVLGTLIKVLPPPDPKVIAQLIADLDSVQFPVRQKATEELERLGELAEPALKQVLAGQPGLEMQMRVERLLERLKIGQVPSMEEMRALRGIEALEAIHTPEARAVLEKLAKGAAGSRVTRDAQRALGRIGARQ